MTNEEYASKLYEQYSAQRQKLDDGSLEAAGRYDKTVLAISTGALALSVTFVEKIAPTPQYWTLWILVSGWVLLLTSVICQLYALSSSQNSVRRQIVILDEQYKDVFIAPDPGALIRQRWNDPPAENPHIRRTHWFNVASQWTLVVGIICILAFSAINIFHKEQKAKETPPASVTQKIELTIVHKHERRHNSQHKNGRVCFDKEEVQTFNIGGLNMTCKEAPPPSKPLKIADESYTPPVNKIPPPPPKKEN